MNFDVEPESAAIENIAAISESQVTHLE